MRCPKCGGRILPKPTGLVVSTGNNSSTLPAGPRRRAASWRASSVQWERSIDVPAPGLTGNAGRAWRIHPPGERQVTPRTAGATPLDPMARG